MHLLFADAATTWVAVGSVATALLAAVTAFLALATMREAGAQFRPVLIPDGHPGRPAETGHYAFGFRNVGSGPALNVIVMPPQWSYGGEPGLEWPAPALAVTALGSIGPSMSATAHREPADPETAIRGCRVNLRYEDLAGLVHESTVLYSLAVRTNRTFQVDDTALAVDATVVKRPARWRHLRRDSYSAEALRYELEENPDY